MLSLWKWLTVLFLLITFVLIFERTSAHIIPPLYRYDDYERCIQEDHGAGTYCFTKVVFSEDRDSFVSLDTPRIVTKFRRNLLDWGICVADCDRDLSELTVDQRKGLFQPMIAVNFTYILPANLWKEYLDPFKNRYAKLINICVNNRLQRDYNLDRLAYSEIEYCTSKDELGMSKKSPDWLMISFYAIVLALIGLVAGANVLDWLGHDQVKEHIIVSSFSVRRNWNRLTEQPKSELYREFGYIDGLRVLTSVIVLGIHSLLTCGIVPLKNVEYTERFLENPVVINYLTSVVIAIQIFFAIGGLLLTVTVLDDLKRQQNFEVSYFKSKILNRLIRIVPVYFFFLLVSIVGDDFPGIRTGTVGYKSLIQERGICRKKWWTNVLFVNNLPVFFGDEHCSSQGWYLAADLQLFLVTLLILAVIEKFSKYADFVLWTSVIIAVAIPARIVYFLGLESCLPVKLSDIQFMYMYQPWHNHIYMPGYSNMDSYLAGVVVGYLYHQCRHNKLNLDNSWLYSILKKARLPLLGLAYLPTFIFYRYEIPRSSWPTLIHAILFRSAGIFTVSVFFIECFRNPPGQVRRFLTSQPMTSLGKLSYSVYVLHVPMFRLLLNWSPPMMDLNPLDQLWILPSVVIISYQTGLIVYLVIEQPASLLLKNYLLKARKRRNID